jgi:hypothetical protein
MKYNVGDLVTCNTEVRKNGRKYILSRPPEEDSILGNGAFQIVSKDETLKSYKIIIDSDMVGWQISVFHVQHEKVPMAFVGKNFWDVTEEYILNKKA